MTPLCQWDFPSSVGMTPINQPAGGGGGGGVTWRQNEPGGMTQVTSQPFNSWPSLSWTPGGTITIVSDSAAPRSPNNVGQFFYNGPPNAWESGFTPGSGDSPSVNAPHVYFCYACKYSSNWQGQSSRVNKQVHGWLGNQGNRLVISAFGTDNNPLIPTISLQGLVSGGNTGGGTSGEYGGPNPFIRGQWHQVECYATANTSGHADGTVTLWFDGVFAASCSEIEFVEGTCWDWDFIQIAPVWGGGTGQFVTADQYWWIDEIYVSKS